MAKRIGISRRLPADADGPARTVVAHSPRLGRPRVDWAGDSWSAAELTVLRLMPPVGDPPILYGKLRHRRLAELGALGDSAEAHREYKRVDRELCLGLGRLAKRGMIRQVRSRGWALVFDSVSSEILSRYEAAHRALVELYRTPTNLADFPGVGVPGVRRELEESWRESFSVVKSRWTLVREKLVEFIERGDLLYKASQE
jgi:hypothetical protein